MKALLFEKYGRPEDVLQIKELDRPQPNENQILVKIHATTINDYDWSLVTGKPRIYRLMFGIFKPKNPIPGMELPGVVEAIGAKVQQWKVGDAVYGDTSAYGFGTFAEYVCLDERALVKKPAGLSFEEAASIPHAFSLALQALRDRGEIKKGHKVLINGGRDGVGTLGLQLAKLYNCEVTGVDSGEKHEMMKSMGYDHVINYHTTDFTRNGVTYDLILDCKSNRSPLAYLRSLKPKSRYVSIGGKPNILIKILFWGMIQSIFTSKKLLIVSLKSNKDLDYFHELFSQNKIKCQIDGPHRLEEIPRLIRYFGEGKHKGKVVIKIA